MFGSGTFPEPKPSEKGSAPLVASIFKGFDR